MTAPLGAAGRLGLVAALALPGVAAAHGFGRLYNLPVPFWLYAWGATAALLVSFLLVLYFVARPVGASPAHRVVELRHPLEPGGTRRGLREG